MLVRDIMTTEVITIPSKTSVIEAKRILDKTNLHRLPVVDKGKLVGIVTVRRLEEAAPPAILSRNMWDVAYSMVALHKIPVKQVMKTKLVTASPTTTVEEALALAQAKKVRGYRHLDKKPEEKDRPCSTWACRGTLSKTGDFTELGDPKYKCNTCKDTGFYGDNGPGRKGNIEYIACDMCPKKTINPQTTRDCNSHDGLIKALKAIANYPDALTGVDASVIIQIAKRAISKATEEA